MSTRRMFRKHVIGAALLAVSLGSGCSPQLLSAVAQLSKVRPSNASASPAALPAVPSAVLSHPGPVKSSGPSLTVPFTPPVTSGATIPTTAPPVYVVHFTHIEDNLPAGSPGSEGNRTSYLSWREQLIDMAQLARRYNLTWVLQPDWTYLVAARDYETADVMAATGGKNVFRYLREDLGVVIDPHAHESGAYNYTDVAELLTRLGVGGTTVIGGHIWDPDLPEFAHWERFRVPVAGNTFPTATWRGDILMGAGTPGHVNDPIVSGVWRPQDPTNFFVDDPTGNIASVGSYRGDIAGIHTLIDRYRTGATSPSQMLTSTYHITPAMIASDSTLAALEASVLTPVQALVAGRQVEVTDFTRLVATWRSRFGSNAYVYKERP